jgi:gamma-glutamyltranspeptidase/glutathione hydrolase
MFLGPEGRAVPERSRTGGLAVAVPGEPAGLALLLARHGTRSPRAVARPAIRLAARGFPMGAHLADALDRTRHPEVRAAFPEPYRHGTRVRRPELARTLRRWARTGGRSWVDGADARAVAAEVQRAGGVLVADDLAAYAVAERAPVVVPFRGWTVVSMAPPSSGGAVLAQVLRVVEDDDLVGMGLNSSAYVHRLTEAFKHAYADRAAAMGDPDFVEVPVAALVGEARVAAVRAAYDPARTLPTEAYGAAAQLPEDGGTQHISVVDAAGGAVALTTTINTSFGSGLVVDGTGVILNDEMDDFAAAPDAPNAFGLVGGDANAVAPGKRPLSSTTPTLVLDADGDVVLAIGASGGSTIISAVTQVILNSLVFGLDPQEAVASPRFHHQWRPDELWLEPGFPADVREALAARGHAIVERPGYSAVQVVAVGEGGASGASDPRKSGAPAAIWADDPAVRSP